MLYSARKAGQKINWNICGKKKKKLQDFSRKLWSMPQLKPYVCSITFAGTMKAGSHSSAPIPSWTQVIMKAQ